MHEMTPFAIVVLNAIREAGNTTLREMEEKFEAEGGKSRAAVLNLKSAGYVQGVKQRHEYVIYSLTDKGERLARTLLAGGGEVALPRAVVARGPLTPIKWAVRDGAEDHKRHGSLRGDAVVPWTAPLLICPAKVEVVGHHASGLRL